MGGTVTEGQRVSGQSGHMISLTIEAPESVSLPTSQPAIPRSQLTGPAQSFRRPDKNYPVNMLNALLLTCPNYIWDNISSNFSVRM